jgi:hypothetical protein
MVKKSEPLFPMGNCVYFFEKDLPLIVNANDYSGPSGSQIKLFQLKCPVFF